MQNGGTAVNSTTPSASIAKTTATPGASPSKIISPSPTPSIKPTVSPSKSSTTNTNLALNKKVAASGYYSSYYPKYAVDSSTSTRWAMKAKTNSYLNIDLGAKKTVSSLTIKWSATNYPKSYVVRSWNGSSWKI